MGLCDGYILFKRQLKKQKTVLNLISLRQCVIKLVKINELYGWYGQKICNGLQFWFNITQFQGR